MKSKIKTLSIILMTLFYIMAGTNHFINPDWYVRIVPPILPFKTAIVYISGILEIILGTLLIFPKTRFIASWGLILLLVAVYPANIYVALTNGEVMDTTPLIAWGRLPFQFVFIGLAYWHSKT
ncbi:MAG TPA: DoxX family protein [Candidatus Marinimicrobia bacterium]|nr:DoxX family protein [Candidatus Neomarinimicrobiota bacterium]